MRILADENIDAALIDWLRGQDHDVLAVRDTMRGASDERVLSLALEDARILLTSDKDFGDLVFRRGLPTEGVVLLRFHTASRREFMELFVSHCPDMFSQAPGNFVIATNSMFRVRPVR